MQRLDSLDVFRGITIAGMILVNNPGDWGHIYGPLKHADWHGWTPTDLVFPFFLFIVGVAIVYALTGLIENPTLDRGIVIRKIFTRTVKIFALGLLLSAFPFFTFSPEFGIAPGLAKLRIMGVLQRIALCYCIASLLYLYVKPRTLYAIGLALLFGYWAALMWIEVPGYGTGNIDSEAGNLTAYLDRLLLTEKHLWGGADYQRDPEGLFSTLPAIGTAILGIRTGLLLRNKTLDPTQKTLQMLIEGVVFLSLGYCWDWLFPINKPLWTSSYVLFTGGQAMCGLALCYYFIDVKGPQRWAFPFKVYGVNALIVFVMSGLLARGLNLIEIADTPMLRYVYKFWLMFFSETNASLLYALTWVGMWYLVLLWMFRRNIIVKV